MATIKWKEEYKRKLISFEGAAKAVKSGDYVVFGLGTSACSPAMYEAILNRHDELQGVTIGDGLQLQWTNCYDSEYMKKLEGQITYRPAFGGPAVRKIMQDKVADPLIAGTGDSGPRLAKIGDVLGFQVTPPNQNGWVNLGLCNNHVGGMLNIWRVTGEKHTIIAEVNDQMPVVYGDNWIHISEIDHIIEHSSEIPKFNRPEPGSIEKAIGNYVVELINDGDTVQIGIGGISEAVVSGLDGKRDLGVITEMFPSKLSHLIKSGVVTNQKKPYHKGISIAGFCVGDQELYDFVTENPSCQIYPTCYSNDIIFLAKHPNLVAMNSAIMVDMSGQIASEGIGHRFISGCGGQFEFMLGAFLSPGGKGITLLSSSSKDKQGNLISSIVPALPEGTPVTVARPYADYVISEYGIARLKYKTRWQRAQELISIAHPDLRGELRKSLRTNFYYPEYKFED